MSSTSTSTTSVKPPPKSTTTTSLKPPPPTTSAPSLKSPPKSATKKGKKKPTNTDYIREWRKKHPDKVKGYNKTSYKRASEKKVGSTAHTLALLNKEVENLKLQVEQLTIGSGDGGGLSGTSVGVSAVAGVATTTTTCSNSGLQDMLLHYFRQQSAKQGVTICKLTAELKELKATNAAQNLARIASKSQDEYAFRESQIKIRMLENLIPANTTFPATMQAPVEIDLSDKTDQVAVNINKVINMYDALRSYKHSFKVYR